jgi:dipeptidyl aminopeptidase/acylaminoacyl peptidase
MEDFFRFVDVRDVQLSPDVQLVCFTMNRLRGQGREPSSPYEYSRVELARRDVWIVSVTGGTPQAITDGGRDGASFWRPEWSPDGQKLMMLSSRGGSNHVWVWSKGSGQLRQLSSFPAYDELASYATHREWISSHEIVLEIPLLDVLGEDRRPTIVGASNPDVSTRRSTASVLRSGVDPKITADTQIAIIDTDTGDVEPLGSVAGADYVDGLPRIFGVSPNGRWVAAFNQTSMKPLNPAESLDDSDVVPDDKLCEVVLFDRRDPAAPKIFLNSENVPVNPWTSFEWSPDGSEFVVNTQEFNKDWIPQRLYHCKIASLSCVTLSPEPGAIIGKRGDASGNDNVTWFEGHQLLVREWFGTFPTAGRTTKGSERWRWCKVDGNGTLLPVGTDQTLLPMTLSVMPDGSDFVGALGGGIWEIDRNGSLLRRLWYGAGQNATKIVRVAKDSLIFSKSAEFGPELSDLRISTGEVVLLPNPDKGAARLIDYNEEAKVLVFSERNRQGETKVWATRVGSADSRILIDENAFVREISAFRTETIPYRTSDGVETSAKVWLPQDFSSKRHYPVIVEVYPMPSCQDSKAEESFDDIKPASMLNEEMFALDGYVVMKPCIPNFRLGGENREARLAMNHDPYMGDLSKGVLPAVDALVELGIADPDRVGLVGHSHGGYAVYALVTQTNRFKAAIALSGYDDLLSAYGTFSPGMRYASQRNFRSTMVQFEELIDRPDGPPWKNLWGYLRNSPIAFVDRVNTPLMIVQGDMDDCLLEQGEEFFTALQRQNKRAEFVRYVGEGHNFQSPQNLYDLWQRQYAWFDEFLKSNGAETTVSK